MTKKLTDGDYLRFVADGVEGGGLHTAESMVKEHMARLRSIARRLDKLDQIERISEEHGSKTA